MIYRARVIYTARVVISRARVIYRARVVISKARMIYIARVIYRARVVISRARVIYRASVVISSKYHSLKLSDFDHLFPCNLSLFVQERNCRVAPPAWWI